MSHERLTLEQRETLRQQTITKHYTANILTHWFNVACWGMLFPTGLGILLGKAYPFVPTAWNNLMVNLFGGLAPLISWHATVGQIWLFVLAFNILFGFRRYFIPFVAQRMWMTKDDWVWLLIRPVQMFGFMMDKQLPPQDAYNGGQKLYMYAVVFGTIGIGVTGMIMTYSAFIPTSVQWLIQWSMPLHFLAMGLTFTGVIVHVYMGAIMPEERAAFFSMFSGKVNGLYAYLHHRKWYEYKMAEKAAYEDHYRAKLAEDAGRSDSGHGDAAPAPSTGD